MTAAASSKVLASHLQRTAYLYIRQSTLHQVFQNTESPRSVTKDVLPYPCQPRPSIVVAPPQYEPAALRRSAAVTARAAPRLVYP